MKKIFVICPVRNASEDVAARIKAHVEALEREGHKVHWPSRDTDQVDPSGTRICIDNGKAILEADEVHLWYDKQSQGSVFDFGMLFMSSRVIGPEKSFVLINSEDVKRTEGKSFQNVILELVHRTAVSEWLR